MLPYCSQNCLGQFQGRCGRCAPNAKKKGFEKPAAEAGANKIRCQLCKMTFASGNALHKHLKDAHSGVHKKKR